MAGFKELGVLKNVFLMFLKEDDQFDFEMEGDDNDFSKLLTFVCRPSFVCSVFFFSFISGLPIPFLKLLGVQIIFSLISLHILFRQII